MPIRPIRFWTPALALLLTACSLSGPPHRPDTQPRTIAGNPEALARQVARGREGMKVDRRAYTASKKSDRWNPIDLSDPDYDAQKYRVTLKFPKDMSTERFEGQVQMTFQPLKNRFQLLALDAAGLEIRSVRLLNTFEELRHEQKGETLLVDLGRAYATTDTLTVLVDYRWASHPNRGLYFRSRDGVEGFESLYSQSESEESKYWFPGYGRPNDRAIFETFVTLPEPYVALSNGALVSTQDHGDMRTYHWSLATPVVSYLFVLTAGKYEVREENWRGIGVQYYGYPGDMDRLSYSLRNTPQMLTLFSDRTGFEYPYEKYAQAVVPQYPWGGMEHVTATTLSDDTVHGPAEDAEYSSDSLVAHELAHQWFGNLATCRNWDHLWLNEGFATFFAAYWMEKSRGKAAYQLELADGAAWYFSEEDEDARPVVFPYYRRNLEDYFDSRSYAKGAWVLHMLRGMLGDEVFFKAIRDYTHRRQGELVVTDDLRKDFERSTGKTLKWFFDQWLKKPGYPKFETSWQADGETVQLTVKQVQNTRAPGGVAGTVPYFEGPIWIELGGIFHRIQLQSRAEQTFRIELGTRPAYVKFNSFDGWLAKVETLQGFDAWKAQLERSPDPTARVEAARALGVLPEISIDIEADQLARVSALSACARGDTEGWVRAACIDSLASIASPANNPQASRSVLDAIFSSSTLAASESDSLVRESLAALLGQFPSKRSIAPLKDMINHVQGLKGRLAALRALGGYQKDTDAYDLLVSQLAVESFQDLVRQTALRALGELGDPRAHALGLEYAASTRSLNSRIGAFSLLGAIGSLSDDLSAVSLAALVPALTDRSQPIRKAAVEALARLGSEGAIPALTRVMESDPDLGVRTSAKDAIDAINGR